MTRFSKKSLSRHQSLSIYSGPYSALAGPGDIRPGPCKIDRKNPFMQHRLQTIFIHIRGGHRGRPKKRWAEAIHRVTKHTCLLGPRTQNKRRQLIKQTSTGRCSDVQFGFSPYRNVQLIRYSRQRLPPLYAPRELYLARYGVISVLSGQCTWLAAAMAATTALASPRLAAAIGMAITHRSVQTRFVPPKVGVTVILSKTSRIISCKKGDWKSSHGNNK
ncbi:hypothetical protein J6590_044244 [Homalodisca vitripennis]|nr:hypothetical protein J6590_044244 [Homalodisca vitripennis]